MYCTVEDVERILGLKSGYFNESSVPSYDDVVALINSYTEYIEKRTGKAWREKRANNGEYEVHPIGRMGLRTGIFVALGFPIYLTHRNIRQFSKASGDAVEFYNGTSWEDWLDTKVEGTDYVVDYTNGIFYVRALFLSAVVAKDYLFRFKYRYGYNEVTDDIRLACAYLVCRQLIMSNDRIFVLPEGGTNIIMASEKLSRMEAYVEDILDRYTEYKMVD
jgi:hypothetical protein